MNYKKAIYLRLFITISVLTGLVLRFYVSYLLGKEDGNILNVYIDTFSYFTIQSNILVLVYFLFSAICTRKQNQNIMFSPTVKGGVTFYITVTGIIYMTVLLPHYHPFGIYAVSTYILHGLVPALVIIDWFLFEARNSYKWVYTVLWLIYPFLYLVYVLIRGKISEWYPYPFVNVVQKGFGRVMLNSLYMLIFMSLLGSLFVFLNQSLNHKE